MSKIGNNKLMLFAIFMRVLSFLRVKYVVKIEIFKLQDTLVNDDSQKIIKLLA